MIEIADNFSVLTIHADFNRLHVVWYSSASRPTTYCTCKVALLYAVSHNDSDEFKWCHTDCMAPYGPLT